jgi:hypothetical protein
MPILVITPKNSRWLFELWGEIHNKKIVYLEPKKVKKVGMVGNPIKFKMIHIEECGEMTPDQRKKWGSLKKIKGRVKCSNH